MSKQSAQFSDGDRPALADDIRHIFGSLDDAKLVDIMALEPTIADAEKASLWLAGDADVFGAGEPLKSVAERIVAILTVDEEDEPARQK